MMKRIIFFITILTVGLCAKAQDSMVKNTAIVYSFKDFNVIVVSHILTDSLLQSPAKERVVTVNSHYLEIFLTTHKDPFLHPVNKVIFDTGSIALEQLQIRYTHYPDGKIYSDWIDVKNRALVDSNSNISFIPKTPDKLLVNRGDYYILHQDILTPYGIRVLEIRNKNTKEELLHLRFKGSGSPVYPFMMLATQSNAEKKTIDSLLKRRFRPGTDEEILEQLRPKNPKTPPVKDKGRILSNEPLYETTDFILFFEKQRAHNPDSSMEFRLFSESIKDTNWIKTGHRLDISNLVAGDHYRLQIRYELHPGYIQEHTFYVVPKWYQTTQTKIIFAGLLILGALLIGLLMYRRLLTKSRRRKEQLSLEIKSIRSQLNPHFIFNALSSIQGLINKNEIPAANRYLTEFSMLLRESLHNHEKEMVPLITEINLLDTYLKLEQLRFNFNYKIDIDETINVNATEIPNLILQPLVENAVKHGVSALAEKGLIKIDFIKKEHDLSVVISDNGNKFDETKHTAGFGLKLTRHRIELLARTLKQQPIKLTIERRQNMETIVQLVFTNWV